jgi:DMSO reductase anchor subunit
MNPAFSVIFLTTLIGVAQGLFLALYGAEVAALLGVAPMPDAQRFFVGGSVLVVVFGALGLVASFFHLGRPERAWRAAAKWRTSWLSREVIAIPLFVGTAALYGLAHGLGWRGETAAIGAAGAVFSVALFACTAMIYACLKFLREWSSPLTIVNYLVLGTASGFTLAAAFASVTAPGLAHGYALIAAVTTIVGLVTRSAALVRNAGLRPKSTLQTAIGIRHPHIVQKSQGFMGGSFNTREFFHGKSHAVVQQIKWGFLLCAFIVPVGLLLAFDGTAAFVLAFVIQYAGLLAERWFFFAEVNHPQNLYYQAMS